LKKNKYIFQTNSLLVKSEWIRAFTNILMEKISRCRATLGALESRVAQALKG
jgi:hypothetical protein